MLESNKDGKQPKEEECTQQCCQSIPLSKCQDKISNDVSLIVVVQSHSKCSLACEA